MTLTRKEIRAAVQSAARWDETNGRHEAYICGWWAWVYEPEPGVRGYEWLTAVSARVKGPHRRIETAKRYALNAIADALFDGLKELGLMDARKAGLR